MIAKRFQSFIQDKSCTLLGVGPVSKNCVDAAIEIANQYHIPLKLIASRRQIECADFGGGYVNNWTTEDFCHYVLTNDKRGQIILARDHGGPWQATHEVKEQLSLRMALESAKHSFEVDIKSGIQFIHIDPSVDIFDPVRVDQVLERLFELYEFCWSTARKYNREVLFEIGTEEQSGGANSLEEIRYVLDQVYSFCDGSNLPRPFMIVVQTGTRVLEMRNVGSFNSPFRVEGEIPAEIQIPCMVGLCREKGIFLKEHNGDYLSDEILAWHPKLGIHATNVAPEFGVIESRTLYDTLKANRLETLAEKFVQLALDSGKFQKWLAPNSSATLLEKAMICGHYVFATQSFAELKNEASLALTKVGIDLDTHLKNSVKSSIMRYAKFFRLIQ